MKFTQLYVNSCTDNTLLQAFHDYFDKKNQAAVNLFEKLSAVTDGHDQPGYVRPDFSETIAYNINEIPVRIDTDEFISALENDLDVITIVHEGHDIEVDVDDVIDQMSESVSASRVVASAIETLAASAGDTAANILSAFKTRMDLTLGALTDSASSIASHLGTVISETGASVTDRIKSILNFVGMYDINTEDNVQVTFPDSIMKEVSGANVWQAWLAECPESILELAEWIKDAVRKAVKLLKDITAIVVGSDAYFALQKFFLTLTGEADSFSYSQGSIDDDTLSNGGFGYRLSYEMQEIIPGSGITQVTTILDHARVLYAALNSDNLYQFPSNQSTIKDILLEASEWTVISYLLYAKNDFQRAIGVMGTGKQPASWMSDSIERYRNYIFDHSEDITIFDLAVFLYWRCVSFTDYGYSSEPLDLYQCLDLALGSWLDFMHINSVSSLTDKLYSNSYTKFELPGSVCYMWVEGSTVCFTRRVKPLPAFMNSVFSIESCLTAGFGLIKKDGRWNLRLDEGRTSGRFYDSIGNLVASIRNNAGGKILTDKQMMNACFAANLMDSIFLSCLHSCRQLNIDIANVDGLLPLSDDILPSNVSLNSISSAITYFSKFLPILTGHAYSELLDLSLMSDENIRNVDLAKQVGADFELPAELSSNGTFMGSTVEFLISPIIEITDGFNSESYFLPYVHASELATGAYHIALDSELANVLSMILKVVAIVTAVVFVMSKIKSLKRKAMSSRTKADAVAWDMVSKGTYTETEITAQYKAYKRADRCEKLSQALFGAVSKTVRTVANSISNAVSATTMKIKNLLSGDKKTAQGKDLSVSDISDEISSLSTLITGV